MFRGEGRFGVRLDRVGELYHFSEDPTIERFVPHVPPTNPTQPPAVWGIDAAHAPLYWFPRDCPRVTAWPRDEVERTAFRAAFSTTADRMHAVEAAWLDAIRATTVYRYTFDDAVFTPWTRANGQYIATTDVVPVAVEPVGDLLALHVAAGIELRLVPDLWPLHDLAVSDRWGFSIVRMRNARPRE